MDDTSRASNVKSEPTIFDANARRADARANRKRVLEAARQVFAEQGLEAEVKDIAERAGVGVATIYRGYGSKTDLLAATAEQAFGQIERLLVGTEDELDPLEALRAFLVGAIEFVDHYGWLVRAWMSGEVNHLHEHPAHPDMNARLENLRRLLTRGIEAGVFPPSMPVETALMVIKGSILSLTFERQRGHQDLPPAEIAENIIQILRGRPA